MQTTWGINGQGRVSGGWEVWQRWAAGTWSCWDPHRGQLGGVIGTTLGKTVSCRLGKLLGCTMCHLGMLSSGIQPTEMCLHTHSGTWTGPRTGALPDRPTLCPTQAREGSYGKEKPRITTSHQPRMGLTNKVE